MNTIKPFNNQHKPWNTAEIEYLTEAWGTVSIGSIAGKLGRSKNAVIVKKNRLNLGSFLENGEYVTFNQLLKAIGYTGGYGYKMKSWIENRGFPLKYKRINSKRVKIVYLDDFWKWAEKNRSFLDFSKFAQHSLGKEPDWVNEQRKKDFYTVSGQNNSPWTSADDDRLKKLLKEFKYTYKDLSEMLKRTDGAIQRRCCDLGIKERPLKAENHIKWTDENLNRLIEGIKSCDSYALIGGAVGKSEKAVRGKVYTMFTTEDLDRVRGILENEREDKK